VKRTVLVTGSNRGLGLETARQLAAAGWNVIGTTRDKLDLADDASIAALGREDGLLDAVVNNAAVSLRGFDADVAQRTLRVNLFGTLAVTAALAPRVKQGGAIVMVSSGMGELSVLRSPARERVERAASREEISALAAEFIAAIPKQLAAKGWPTNAYSVSKVLLNAATRVLAREFEPRQIRVNAVCPGWVRTDLGGPNAPRDVKTGAASIVAAVDVRTSGGFFRDGERIAW
jgi:NAD(P)-dependent dehydrogenase (short-subunit alcohol dehydrogenase family)